VKIFIDSADPNEIARGIDLGIVDGVTTNPTLIAKSGKNLYDTAAEICKIAEGLPVSIEVASTEYEKMLEEGKKILDIADNVVLKLPIIWSGLKACNHFHEQGRETNMTLCFSASQALLAAKAGATYVSPFIGRLDDIGHDGSDLISEIKEIFSNYPEYNANILAASIRHSQHFYSSSLIGADAATMPLKVIEKLINHPLTDKGLDIFINDWKNSGLSI